MRTLLIVSPNFPPVSAADMHRVRLSLPHFSKFGWRPIVLAVEPKHVEGVKEALLLETIPQDVTIRRVRAMPVALTRTVGLGNLAIRAFPFLYRAGSDLIKRHKVDLIL